MKLQIPSRVAVIAALLLLPACGEDEPDPECERSQKIALTFIQAGSDPERVRATFELTAPEDCDWPLE